MAQLSYVRKRVMAEYTAPKLVNNYISANVLTNITPGSIMLQTQTNASDENILPTITEFLDGQSLLYNNVVVSDTTALGYNADIIQEYITNEVLSTSIITPKSPIGTISGLSGATHTISINNSQLTKKASVNKVDTLEIYYSININNLGSSLTILVYRGLSGFYYSLDGGSSIIAIPTLGMMYPTQVTSIAIQNISSITTPGNIKIWAGTLQEGLLSYTIGSSSWISETDIEQITGQYLFRHSLNYITVDTSNTFISNKLTHQGYAPTYILGLINNPPEAGLPIIVYTKPLITSITEVQSSFTANIINNIMTLTSVSGSTTTLVGQTLLGNNLRANLTVSSLFSGTDNQIGAKYILSENTDLSVTENIKAISINSPLITKNIYVIYKYTSLNYASYILNTKYNIYNTVVLPNVNISWTLLSSNPFTNEVCDVLKSVPYLTSYGMNNSSQLITTVAAYSHSLNSYTTEVIYISINNDINYGSIQRQINIVKDPIIGTSININPNQFTGISSFDTDIFITTRNQIFRNTNNVWNSWLITNDTSTVERNTAISNDYVFTLNSPVSYVTGLRGFGVIKGTAPNTYYGIVNTDLGDIVITCSKTRTDYLSPITNSKTIRTDIFGASVRDLQIIPEINTAFSCGLLTEPINRYKLGSSFSAPIRYSSYIPDITTKLPSNISYNYNQIFYKNYLVGTDSIPYFINKFTDFNLSSINQDQLYLNTENSMSIYVLKSLYSIFTYLDTTNNFNWLNDTITSGYVSKNMKYNRLKILLQTIQNIPLVNATLSANLEIPFIPDIDF